MALDKDRLGTAIWTAVKALHSYDGDLTPEMDEAGELLWQTIAEQIILEFTTNAVVTSTAVDPPGDGGTVNSTGQIS